MKRDTNSEQKRPAYSGSVDVEALYALREQGLQRKLIENQKMAIMADKTGEAAKAIAGVLYKVGIEAPIGAAYRFGKDLAHLATSAGIGMAKVGADVVIGAYSALAKVGDGEDSARAYQTGVDAALRDIYSGNVASGPIIDV